MSLRSARVLIRVAVLSALVVAITADLAPATTASSGGTLRVVVPALGEPTLDPAVAAPRVGPYDELWAGLWYATCATLVAFRDAPAPEGYTLRPEAATGLPRVSRDGRTYVFTVRKGLRFSDGSPLGPGNFARALGRVLDPAMGSAGAPLFSDVSASASGSRLTIKLRRRTGDLLTRLALPYACPVPTGFPVDPAGVPLMIGSGPYYVARYETGSLLVLKRNPFYRGSRPHETDSVVFTIGGDAAANISAVEAGQADVSLGNVLPIEARAPLARRYGVNKNQLFRIRGTVDYFLALNSSRPLFRGNVALRKAVNLAIDRTEIAKAGPGWPLSQTPTDQILPRWVPGWIDHRLYPLAGPDLRLARRFAAANLRGGTAVLYSSEVPFLLDQANVIAQQLSQIGLKVTVTPLAPAAIDGIAGTPGAPYDMLLTRYFLRYPDPADVMSSLVGGENARRQAGNTNLAYFDNPTYNRRMAAADRFTGSARLRAFSRLDAAIMHDAAPYAPLYEGSSWLFVSKRVGCLKLHPVFRIDLAAMCLR